MTTDQLVVNFGALQQASADINSAINSMQSQLADAEQAAQPLVSTWTGAAQEAYHVRQQTWRQAADDLTQMLQNIKAAVEDAAQNYQQTEDRNRAMFE